MRWLGSSYRHSSLFENGADQVLCFLPSNASCFPAYSQWERTCYQMKWSCTTLLVCSPVWSSQVCLTNKRRLQLELALPKWKSSWWETHQLSAEAELMLFSRTMIHTWPGMLLWQGCIIISLTASPAVIMPVTSLCKVCFPFMQRVDYTCILECQLLHLSGIVWFYMQYRDINNQK